LLPLTVGTHCVDVDVNKYRRAKSDEEVDALVQLSQQTLQLLQLADSEKSFRGAMKYRGNTLPSNVKTAFTRKDFRGFVQYRAGLKDELGRVSDHTRIVPKTPEWADRLERAYRGLYDVASKIRPGATVAELNNVFMTRMKPTDTVYGNVVHSTGYEWNEVGIPLDELQPHDMLALSVAVGDKKSGEVAMINAAVQVVKPLPPLPPPPPPPPVPPPSSFVRPRTTSKVYSGSSNERRQSPMVSTGSFHSFGSTVATPRRYILPQ